MAEVELEVDLPNNVGTSTVLPESSLQSSVLTWKEKSSLPIEMKFAQAVWFEDQLCVGGGIVTGEARDSAKLYTYRPQSTEACGAEWQTRNTPTSNFALAIYRSELLLIGGYDFRSSKLTDQIYTLVEGQFKQPIVPMCSKRCSASAISKGDFLLVAGGLGESDMRLSSVELYDGLLWSITYSLPIASRCMKSVIRGDDWWLAGGYGQEEEVFCMSLQSLISGCDKTTLSPWKKIATVPFQHSTLSFINDQLLSIGGRVNGRTPTSAIYAYSKTDKSWLYTDKLPIPLRDSCSVVLPSGEIVVLGGTSDKWRCSNRVFEAAVRVDVVSKKLVEQLSPDEGSDLSVEQSCESSPTDLHEKSMDKSHMPSDVLSKKVPTSDSFYLPGVDVVGQTSLTVTNEVRLFHWKGYGFKLHIPPNSLPKGVHHCDIHIIASTAGQYNFPCELVSAVFWIRCDPAGRFQQPLTAELQHCAQKRSHKNLKFLRALCSQSSLPYSFTALKREGSFSDHSSYGSIQLERFSGIAIGGFNNVQRLYIASLYYLGREVNNKNIHFVICWDDEAHVNPIRQYYINRGAKEGCDLEVEFNDDKIQLNIPMCGITVGQWTITPLVQPSISKKRVDYYTSGRRIPSFQLKAKCDLSMQIPELLHPISLTGTKDPNSIITIDINPSQAVMPRLEHSPTPAVPAFDLCSDSVCPSYHELVQYYGIDESSLSKTCSIEHLTSIAKHIQNWQKYAEALGLLESEIQGIRTDPSLDGPMKTKKMLKLWFQTNDYRATYRRFVIVCLDLRDAQLAGEICKLLQNHPAAEHYEA